MSELLARAADAIGDTLNQKTTQETLEVAARAAIAAIREPTKEMIHAAYYDALAWDAAAVFRAMIDKILEG
jgi:hypothetical protein